MIFDSHAHYDDSAFDADRGELLAQMAEHGITKIVNVGASVRGVEASQALAEQYPFIYAAVGVHPDEVGHMDEQKLLWMYDLCRRPKTVAVGEIGLDYYWDKEAHDFQKLWFRKQLQMAKDTGLPINVHSRDAAQDTFDIIKKEHAGTTGGVIHCFSSSAEMAMEYVKLGYFIGVGGVVTFKNAKKLKETVQQIPLERILLETDCPYMTPVPHRGERNDSRYIRLVAEKIAQIKSVNADDVLAIAEENAKKLFSI